MASDSEMDTTATIQGVPAHVLKALKGEDLVVVDLRDTAPDVSVLLDVLDRAVTCPLRSRM